jgi:hypothetical protein
MTEKGSVYEFAFRGLLAEEALDAAGGPSRVGSGMFDSDIAQQLSLDVLHEEHVRVAKLIAAVYVAIAAFENSVRQLVTNVLREAVGDTGGRRLFRRTSRPSARTGKTMRPSIASTPKRGEAPISYTDLKQPGNIIRAQWPHFADFLPSAEWATAIFDAIERPRNVIMHSGVLSPPDIARIGTNLRDWVVQVGT